MSDDPTMPQVYVIIAALTGAITALSFMRWKEMSRVEILLTLGVGASFAIFVTPWIAHSLLGIPTSNSQALAALTWVSASGSNILIPMAIRWLGRAFGQGEASHDVP